MGTVEAKYAEGHDFIPDLFDLDQQNTRNLVEHTMGRAK